jgi:transcriptional regulator with XRE-family HTH domain
MPRHAGTSRQRIEFGLPAVCRRLDAARERRGWSVHRLGHEAGIDEKAAGKLLRPETFGEPQLGTMTRIAQALGLTLDGLFGLPATNARIPPDAPEPIAWICRARGWSLSQLAREAGLTSAATSAMATGKNRPDLLSALAIARASGVSLDSLAAAALRARNA